MNAEATNKNSGEPRIKFWIGKIGMPCRLNKLQVNRIKAAGMTQREAVVIRLV